MSLELPQVFDRCIPCQSSAAPNRPSHRTLRTHPRNNGITNTIIGSLTMDPSNPSVLYAGNWISGSMQLYKTINAGDTWAASGSGLDSTAGINVIAVDPTASNIVYAGTDAGVYKSIDGGASWLPSSAGLANLYVRDLAIDPDNHNTVYAATWGGLFKSIEGGTVWLSVSDDFATQFAKTVTICPSNSQTVYAGVFGNVYRSTDTGSTWSYSDTGLEMDIIVSMRSVAIDHFDGSTIYMGTCE